MRECIYLGVKFHYNNNKTKHRYDTYNFKDSQVSQKDKTIKEVARSNKFLYYLSIYFQYLKQVKTSNLFQICYNKNIKLRATMFILMPCATVKDEVVFSPVGDISKTATDFSKIRAMISSYTNVEFLLERIQAGEVIMSKKIQIDQYLKNQVELMRAHVQNSIACPFSYTGYMDPTTTISTAGMGTKEQWAVQMVMSRYNICSIYHAAAYSSLEYIFTETSNSLDPKFKDSPKFINNLQIAFKYFNEGYQPLKRLSEVYSTLEFLLTPTSQSITEVKKEVFFLVRDLIGCNLAYLKTEKYRIMGQYRACKENAYSIHMYLLDAKKKLKSSNLMTKIHQDIAIYLDLGELFFLCLAYYYLLEEHEDMKNKEQYGFIKKQFQEMISQNCVVCQQFIKVQKQIKNFPNKQNLDNAQFAENITDTLLIDVKKKQYAYGINIHQNKSAMPTIQEVIAKRISPKNIWESINQF